MNLLGTRFIGLVDVPDPLTIRARFVYNFFVPDERVDDSGRLRFHGIFTEATQKAIDDRILDAQVPRFIEIYFDPVNAGDGNIQDLGEQSFLTEERPNISTESTITTPRDAIFRYKDSSLAARLRGRAEILATLAGSNNNTKEQIDSIIELNDKIDAKILQQILSPDGAAGVSYVNVVGDLAKMPIFTQAATLTTSMLLERRLLIPLLSGDILHNDLPTTQLIAEAVTDSIKFLPITDDDSGPDSFEPEFKVIKAVGDVPPSDEIKTLTVGYIIERKEIEADGTEGNLQKYYLDGQDNTRFLDTKIKYGSTYDYAIRTVALIEMTVPEEGNEDLAPGIYRVWSLLASRPSKSSIVRAIELIPPKEPDGIFYRFDYDRGKGLIIRWQIPVGKQRDVKYFQIFRRKTIYEPYTCIAEIDFDDSEIKTSRSEKINDDRIIKATAPLIQYVDSEFSRNSSYMYAVVALDAHGYTSGYSTQSLVSFDRVNNTIQLKTISKSGAPKQYPNFFIDPDLDDNIFVDSLTQDVMQSSKKFTAKIYFAPDTINISSRDGNSSRLFKTQQQGGVYKFHLLNIDRQKSAILELNIDDLR